MYAYIKGTLGEVREDYIVIENNGIGYRVYVPLRIIEQLPPRGSDVMVHTYLHVREDAFLLYGFSSEDELTMFRLLINVSGIGPKGAIALLSALSPNDIRLAVASEDIKTVSRAPGIGKKTAQRLIIELKDKVSLEPFCDFPDDTDESASDSAHIIKKEAIEALASLGYSYAEAAKIISGMEISDDMTVETVLKQALKNIAFL